MKRSVHSEKWTCPQCGRWSIVFKGSSRTRLDGNAALDGRLLGLPRSPSGKMRKRCASCHQERSNAWTRSERAALLRSGSAPCTSCNRVVPVSSMARHGSRCLSCKREAGLKRSSEERTAERARAAAREGKDYRTRLQSSVEADFRRTARLVGIAHRAWYTYCQQDVPLQIRRRAARDRYRRRYKRIRDTEIARARDSKQRYRDSYAASGITAAELAAFRGSAERCFYCNASLLGRERHVDHMIPLSRGGRSEWSNLVVACARCNLSKADRRLEDWWEDWQPDAPPILGPS